MSSPRSPRSMCLRTIDEYNDIELGANNHNHDDSSTFRSSDDGNSTTERLHNTKRLNNMELHVQNAQQQQANPSLEYDDRGSSSVAAMRVSPTQQTIMQSSDVCMGTLSSSPSDCNETQDNWSTRSVQNYKQETAIDKKKLVSFDDDDYHSHLRHHPRQQRYHHQPTKQKVVKKDQSVVDLHRSNMTKRKGAFVVVGILVAIIVIALCVAFSTTTPHTDNNHSNGTTAVDTSGEELVASVLRERMSNNTEMLSSLNKVDSPQRKALQWLSNDDLVESRPGHRLYQRFVLATLYMSTDGENWNLRQSNNVNTTDRNTTTSSLTASVVALATTTTEDVNNLQNFGEHDSVSYLNPYTHECTWTGIVCSSDGGETDDVVSSITLSGRNLNGKLPREIGLLSHLRQLRLGENALTGVIPETIQELSNLEYIDISQNQMTGTIPSGLWSLSLLEYIYLYDNALHGHIDGSYEENRRQHSQLLHDVWLHQNQLTGSIPSWFGDLQQLESLILFDNLLTGNVQKSILSSLSDANNDGLSRLSFLDLSSNMLWGSIPSDNGLRSLSHLDVSSNLIGGRIPSNLFNSEQHYYPSLRHVYLHNNMLSGDLPSGNTHSNVQNLWLNSNHLTGTIADQFGSQWYRLKELLLYDNKFTGNITECTAITSKNSAAAFTPSVSRFIPQYWPEIDRLEADCSIPSVECSCCTECYTP